MKKEYENGDRKFRIFYAAYLVVSEDGTTIYQKGKNNVFGKKLKVLNDYTGAFVLGKFGRKISVARAVMICFCPPKPNDGKTGKRRYVINSIYQKNISFFPHVWLPNRHKEITIDRFLDIIQKGTYSTSKGQQNRTIADVIIEIRGKTDPDEIAKMKKDWLPVACINGVFETKHDHSITTYSSFVALDYDHFADDVAKEKAKDHLKQFPFVYAIFETPSGHGIKALILHDSLNPEHHYNLFTQLLKVCSLPEIDNVVSDISRGQFFSYDPGLWRNPSPEAFHFEYDPSITPPSPKKEMSVNGEKGIVKLDSGTTAFLHKLWEMVLTDDAVIERLDKHNHERFNTELME